jgi:hypothetical protein
VRLISKVSPQARQRKSYRGIYTAYGLGVTLRRPGPPGRVACGYRTRSMGLAGGRRAVVSSGWRMGRTHPRSGAGYVPRRLIMMGRWVVPVPRPTIPALVCPLPLGDPLLPPTPRAAPDQRHLCLRATLSRSASPSPPAARTRSRQHPHRRPPASLPKPRTAPKLSQHQPFPKVGAIPAQHQPLPKA